VRRCVLVLLVLLVILVQLPANASDTKTGATGPLVSSFSASAGEVGTNAQRPRVDEALRSSPTMFIENVGQFAEGARFQMWGGLGTAWLAEDGIWITLVEKDEVGRARPERSEGMKDEEGLRPSSLILPPSRKAVHLKLSFVGANAHPRLEPYSRLETKVSYFIGAGPEKWHVDVPVWGGVRYVDLYPGVDLVIGEDEGGRRKRAFSLARNRERAGPRMGQSGAGVRAFRLHPSSLILSPGVWW